MTLESRRQHERDKYRAVYSKHGYTMGPRRKPIALRNVDALPVGRLLDIGCGRGEILSYAASLGHTVTGTEIVESLIGGDIDGPFDAWDIPYEDASFDAVICLDVLEHLLPEDGLATLREMARLTRSCLLVSISNRPSVWDGEEMHINRRPYDDWDADIRAAWAGFDVRRLKSQNEPSATWRADKHRAA